MLGKRLVALLGGAAIMILAPRADAATWQELHETSDDVRLDVGRDGVANVQHHLRYRIVAGHFRSFDLVGIDPRADIAPDAVLTPEKGGEEVPLRVERLAQAPGTLRLMLDEAKGIGRGAYLVDVKYRIDLVSTKMLTRDGAMWKLAWTAPPAPEGHDGARVVFDLPSAPTEPRLAAAADTTTTLPSLRRGTERDELELVRAHVPRGEAVTWTARVDPKAFPQVSSPELRPPPPPEVAPPSLLRSNLSRILVSLGFSLLAAALAALLRKKQESVRAAAAIRNVEARRLVPLPCSMAPFAYGVTAALSLATLLWWSPAGGACLVALAMALAAHRAPRPIVRPRGPGAWRPMADPDALLPERAPLPTDALDVATARGLLIFGGLACAVIAAAWLLRAHVPQIAIALPLASASLVPIFVTGTRSQNAPTPRDLAACMLRPARDALASTVDLAHVDLGTIGRVIAAGAERPVVDEVRLACAPRDRTPGLRAIELALAPSTNCHGATPEVFVRFDDGSPTADRVAGIATGIAVVPGRTPEEKVVRLTPDEPTSVSAAALMGRLLLALEGRRATDRKQPPARPCWRGNERRRRLVARAGTAKPVAQPKGFSVASKDRVSSTATP